MPGKIARFEPFRAYAATRHAFEAQELVTANPWLEDTPYALDLQQFSSVVKAVGNVTRLALSRQTVGIIYDAEGRQASGDVAPARYPIGIGTVAFGYQATHPESGIQLNCALADYWLTNGVPSMHSAAARCLAKYARSCLPQGRRLEAVLGTVQPDEDRQPAGFAFTYEDLGEPRQRVELNLPPNSRYEPFQDQSAITQLYIASDIKGIELGHLG